jgi:hypothetical protein
VVILLRVSSGFSVPKYSVHCVNNSSTLPILHLLNLSCVHANRGSFPGGKANWLSLHLVLRLKMNDATPHSPMCFHGMHGDITTFYFYSCMLNLSVRNICPESVGEQNSKAPEPFQGGDISGNSLYFSKMTI